MSSATQTENLARVKRSIADIVLSFLRIRWRSGHTRFVIRELHDFVYREAEIAPGSADRILRQLRLDGVCGYDVINRQKSLYVLTSLRRTRMKTCDRLTWNQADPATDAWYADNPAAPKRDGGYMTFVVCRSGDVWEAWFQTELLVTGSRAECQARCVAYSLDESVLTTNHC